MAKPPHGNNPQNRKVLLHQLIPGIKKSIPKPFPIILGSKRIVEKHFSPHERAVKWMNEAMFHPAFSTYLNAARKNGVEPTTIGQVLAAAGVSRESAKEMLWHQLVKLLKANKSSAIRVVEAHLIEHYDPQLAKQRGH